MAKIMHIKGLVRSASIQRRKSNNEPYGTRWAVLTEPKGDTCDVLVFDRVLTPSEAEQLEGHYVEITVQVSSTPGTQGGAFLNVNVESIDTVLAPDEQPVAA